MNRFPKISRMEILLPRDRWDSISTGKPGKEIPVILGYVDIVLVIVHEYGEYV